MSDKKIERLRNLMGPIFNYFKVQEKLETGDYPDIDYPKLDKLLYEEDIRSRKNLKEIKDILKEL